LHMFHLAFSPGEEHASAAFRSIAHAQSRGFEPRWPSIEDEVSHRSAIDHILRRHYHLFDLDGRRPPSAHGLRRSPRGQAGRPGATGELGDGCARKARAPNDPGQHAQEWRPHRYRVVRSLRAQSRRERGRFARDDHRPRDRPTTPMHSLRRQGGRYETGVAYGAIRAMNCPRAMPA
jgi:hypothetical protein